MLPSPVLALLEHVGPSKLSPSQCFALFKPVPDFDSLSAGFDPNNPLDGASVGFDPKSPDPLLVSAGFDPKRPVEAGFWVVDSATCS